MCKFSGVIDPLRAGVLVTVVATSAASGQYADGFVWQRSVDYDRGLLAGSSQGNPNDDSLGNHVWHYGWVDYRNETDDVPWFVLQPTTMVWDDTWFGRPELAAWRRGNDTSPNVGQDYIEVVSSGSGDPNRFRMPVVTWTNPVGRAIEAHIAGRSGVAWAGTTIPAPIELVIAKSTSGGESQILYSESYDKPSNDSSDEWVDVVLDMPHINLATGERLTLAIRKTVMGKEWAYWWDVPVTITLTNLCPADFNEDNAVNSLDVLSFLNAWNSGESSADVDDDGAVNTLDVLAYVNLWAAGC